MMVPQRMVLSQAVLLVFRLTALMVPMRIALVGRYRAAVLVSHRPGIALEAKAESRPVGVHHSASRRPVGPSRKEPKMADKAMRDRIVPNGRGATRDGRGASPISAATFPRLMSVRLGQPSGMPSQVSHYSSGLWQSQGYRSRSLSCARHKADDDFAPFTG